MATSTDAEMDKATQHTDDWPDKYPCVSFRVAWLHREPQDPTQIKQTGQIEGGPGKSPMNIYLELHLDSDYHAHPELKFEIVREPGKWDLDSKLRTTATAMFHGDIDIKCEKLQSSDVSDAAKWGPFQHFIKHGSLRRISINFKTNPAFHRIFVNSNGANKDLMAQMRSFVSSACQITSGEESRELVLYAVHDLNTKVLDQIDPLNVMMKRQYQNFSRPYLRLHRGEASFSDGYVPQESRPNLFYKEKKNIHPPARQFYMDFEELVTLQVYPHKYNDEAEDKKKAALSQKSLKLLTLPTEDGNADALVCLVHKVPITLAVGDKLLVAIDGTDFPAKVIAPLSITPDNQWLTILISRATKKEDKSKIPFPASFRVHDKPYNVVPNTLEEFRKIPINTAFVSLDHENAPFSRQVKTLQEALEKFQADPADDVDGRLLRQWANVLTGQFPLFRGRLDFFRAERNMPDFDAREARIPTTPSTENIKLFLKALPSGIGIFMGPPGTGKSYLLGTIVCTTAINGARKILIVAPSNTACDVVIDKIMEVCQLFGIDDIDLIRLYSRGLEDAALNKLGDHANVNNGRTSTSGNGHMETLVDLITAMKNNTDPKNSLKHLEHSLPFRIFKTCTRQDGNNDPDKPKFEQLFHRRFVTPESFTDADEVEFDRLYEKFRRVVLRKTQVVIGTPHAVSDPKIAKDFPAKTILLDEAAMMSEIDTLMVKFRYLPEFVLFFGDPLQLQPACFLTSLENKYKPQILKSCMERLQDNGIDYMLLTKQFRQAGKNYELTSNVFYNGLLSDAPEKTALSVPARAGARSFRMFVSRLNKLPNDCKLAKDWTHPQILFNMEGSSRKDVTLSSYNRPQVALIVQLTERLLIHLREAGEGFGPENVTIVTPYLAQNKLIKKAFLHHSKVVPGIENVRIELAEIKSVDSFQGGENNFVIYNTVITAGTGHYLDEHRSNVALSRAKDGLIVVASVSGFVRWSQNQKATRVKKFQKVIDHFYALKHVAQADPISEETVNELVPSAVGNSFNYVPSTNALGLSELRETLPPTTSAPAPAPAPPGQMSSVDMAMNVGFD